jgi:hypothetical protein
MAKRFLLPFAFVLTLCFHCAHATSPFQALPKSGEEDDAVFCGVSPAPIIKIIANGQIQLANGTHARLPLDEPDSLDRVWIYVERNALYVAYETSQPDGSSGGVCRFTSDGQRRLWCTPVPAFNVVAAVSDSGALYVAGIGMIGRIRKTDGRYLWKTSGLYKRHGVNVFRVPIEEGRQVVFVGGEGLKDSPVKRIVVNRDSGRILSMQTLPGDVDVLARFISAVQGCQ